jgi:hypothetical protein
MIFDPRQYNYDPSILEARRNTIAASKGAELDFGEGFSGGQDLSEDIGQQAWATSGLSGQLLSLLYSEDKQLDWFVQRHGVDVAGADINQIQAQINAMKEEAKLRELTESEVSKVWELMTLRKNVVEGLAYSKKYAEGDLDAEIYKNGDSFNDRWGIPDEEQAGLEMFFKVLKENPSYTAGAIVGELVKDFPITAASIFGLSKVNSLGKAVRLVNRRLASIRSKTGRTVSQLGTGIGTGAVAGAGYEAGYTALDQGSVKSEETWMGAKFGGLFGILGGLTLMQQGGKIRRGNELVKQRRAEIIRETSSGAEASMGKVAMKATREATAKADSIFQVVDTLDTDQRRISAQAKEMIILADYQQQIRTMPKDDTSIVRTELSKESDDIITYINESRLEQQRKDILKEIERKIEAGEDVDNITFRNLATLKNKDAFKALTEAQSKVRGKFMLDERRGKPLPEDWEADVLATVKTELDLFDRNYQARQEAKKRQYELDKAEEALKSPSGKEAIVIADKIKERKQLDRDIKRLSDLQKRTPEEEVELRELEAKAREIDEKEGLATPPLGKAGRWITENPKKAMAAGAVAGVTLLPGTTQDKVYSAIAGAGIAFAGPKAYKSITRASFNQAAWKAKAAIQKGIEASANDMKVLEMKMQYTMEAIKDTFKSKADGLRLISYLETGKNKNKDGAKLLEDDELELAKDVRAILDLIGDEAVDAGIIKKTSDMTTGKFKKGEQGAFLHNYFPHLFNNKMTDEDLAALVEIWGRDSAKSGLERVMMGSIEMIKEHYPKQAKNLIDDPARALELYTQAMTKAIHGKRMLNSLKELDLSMGKGTFLPALMTEEAFQILKRKGDMTEQELLHYEVLDHSSLNGFRVHTDMKALVDDHFDVLRKGTLSEVAQSVLDLNNGLKRVFVFGSMFHGQALLTSLAYSLGVKGLYHGVKGSPDAMLRDGTAWSHLKLGSKEFKGLAEHAIRNGLQIINIKKQELVTPGREKINNLLDKWGKQGEIPKKVFDGIDYLTWEYFHDRFKLATFLRKEEEIIKNLKKKGFKDNEAREIAGREAAEFANDAYGSLDWNNFTTRLYEYAAENPTKLRGRIAGMTAEMLPVKKRKWLNLGLFAPDWTISNLRIVGRMFTLGYKYTDHQIKSIHRGQGWNTKEGQAILESWKMYAAYSARAGVINSALWYMTMQLFSDKEPTMDELADFWYGESSHKVDLGGGHSVVISKQIAEPIHWIQHPMHTFSNKMSVVPKTGMELFMNKQWFSLKKSIPIGPALIDADGNYHHAKWLLGKVTPIVIKPIFQDDLSFGERLNRILTGFGGFPQYNVKE